MSKAINIPNCEPSQIKGKVKNLRDCYKQTILWRNKTGQGVREEEGEDSFERKERTFIN
jgi:hypothetical protein